MSGDPVLRDELAAAIRERHHDNSDTFVSRSLADAVLAHPRVAAALRVLEAVDAVKPDEEQAPVWYSADAAYGWMCGYSCAIDALRAVAVEQ